MKNLVIIILVFFTPLVNEAQVRGLRNIYISPLLNKNQITPLDCNTIINSNNCNKISNGTFEPSTSSFDQSIPFNSNQVTNWVTSHGSPQIYNATSSIFYLNNILPPNGVSSYSLAFTEYIPLPNNSILQTGEGIAQKISPLNTGDTYQLTFKEFQKETGQSPFGIANVKIVLMHCNNFNTLQVTDYLIPNIPNTPDYQQINCGSSIEASLNWTKRAISFTANSDFDIIMIYPQYPTSNNTNSTWLLTTDFQLTKPNSLNVLVSPNPTNNCIMKASVKCILYDITYTWTGPSGQSFTGTNLNIDASIAANVGTWTLATSSMTPVVVANNTCSTNGYVPMQTSFIITAPVLPCVSSCINLPLIQ
jgi:hypothetical protein